ncbi:uncharacterized protein [Heterodontus francisci]|uniref:uncharacterized protein n=1 Tax=Heterodontus francisci TaxID=7792 RepID=UPI00355C3020
MCSDPSRSGSLYLSRTDSEVGTGKINFDLPNTNKQLDASYIFIESYSTGKGHSAYRAWPVCSKELPYATPIRHKQREPDTDGKQFLIQAPSDQGVLLFCHTRSEGSEGNPDSSAVISALCFIFSRLILIHEQIQPPVCRMQLVKLFLIVCSLLPCENDTIRPAKVTVFEPSPEEIREKKKATVVCLVSDFYPDNIKIHWLVDGKEKDANDTNIHTDLNAILSKENTSYSISSRLRFDALDWARSKNVECRVDLYTNESVPATSSSTLAVKAEMCGISKEAKIQSMATAKLTYLILICKSIFYAIFISTIAWKTKTSYSKRFD